MIELFRSPAVVVDLDIVEKNIKKMIDINKKFGINHRPHIKPHKSLELAKLQLSMGATGITCAKLAEAEVMVMGGIKDILIAFPILGKEKLDRLEKLINFANITTIVNSVECAKELSDLGIRIGKKIAALIEVDGGGKRGGLKPGKNTVEFVKEIKDYEGIDICGIMYYSSSGYDCDTWSCVEEGAVKEKKEALETADLVSKLGIHMRIISCGSSFSGKCPKYMEGVTEVRSGNYIFNDCAQLSNNFVSLEDCALRVYSTVIACPSDKEAIIDAGSKTLTSDLCKFREGYGFVVGRPDICIHNLNEEHGFIRSEGGINLKIGDKIGIIPNHACVIPNLTDDMYGIRNGKFSHMIKVDARGKNY